MEYQSASKNYPRMPGLCVLVLGVFFSLIWIAEADSTLSFPMSSYIRRSSSPLLRTSPRYVCKREEVRIAVPVRDCGVVYLRTHACRGHCPSVSFPEWASLTESMHNVRFCYCCKPTTTETIPGMIVNCRGRDRYVRLNLRAASECHCRPCSDGQPRSEQPYDY